MATIFCFTSTGNSLYTSKKICEKIGGKILTMKEASLIWDDNVIGFVFPVFFWGMPRIVERFVTDLQITNKDAYVFAVATCGGYVFGEFGRLKKLLRVKGINFQYGEKLISITNYLPEYTVKDNEEIRQKIDYNISKICTAIQKRTTNHILHSTLFNAFAYKLYPSENSDRYFTVSSSCTGCTTCQKICPVDNISINLENNPTFNHRCEHCLACLHACPVNAIDWKEKTKGKDRYRRASISIDELIEFNK